VAVNSGWLCIGEYSLKVVLAF